MNELDIKTERLVRMLEAENADGVLLNAQHNFAWLTGGGNNGVDLSQPNGVGSLLVTKSGKRFVIANRIEMPRLLTEEVSYEDFEPIDFDWQQEKKDPRWVTKIAGRIAGYKLCYDTFWHPSFEVCEGLIAKCRYQLTVEEIERFRKLGRVAGKILGEIYNKIEVGQTEKQIANQVKFELGKSGITSVVTLVAADERIQKYRHPIPTDNIWKKVLLVVVCAKRDGLIASLSRIACVGEIPDELRRKTDAVAHVFANFMSATRRGTIGADIYKIAADAYKEKDFGDEINKHHQGGAAGYKTRDWIAHPQSSEIIQNNQAFAWNPSITGTKAEETVIVNEDKIEYLTVSSNFPRISTVIDGNEFFAPDILKL